MLVQYSLKYYVLTVFGIKLVRLGNKKNGRQLKIIIIKHKSKEKQVNFFILLRVKK